MKWVNKYWSTLGGIIALGIILTVVLNNNGITNLESLVWIHLAILLLHQFEEYTFPGGFKNFYNNNILNKSVITRFPLNNTGILLVNVILAWTAYFLAALFGAKAIWLTVGLLGVTILNGVMHTMMFLLLRKYNPGLITGFFLFIPFGIYLISKLSEYMKVETLIIGLAIFLIGTVLIPISIRLTSNKTMPNRGKK